MSRPIVYLTERITYLFNDKTIIHVEWSIIMWKEAIMADFNIPSNNICLVLLRKLRIKLNATQKRLHLERLGHVHRETDRPVPKPSIAMFVNPISIYTYLFIRLFHKKFAVNTLNYMCVSVACSINL
jgi:hypothetical protein